jgi:hypothetical protein
MEPTNLGSIALALPMEIIRSWAGPPAIPSRAAGALANCR